MKEIHDDLSREAKSCISPIRGVVVSPAERYSCLQQNTLRTHQITFDTSVSQVKTCSVKNERTLVQKKCPVEKTTKFDAEDISNLPRI